jgi:hypothetical protein
MSTIMLKDAPGGAAFIQSCTNAIADMALAFAGEPDGLVLEHMHLTRGTFEAELTAQIGSKAAAAIVDGMIAAVIGEKHRLERLRGGTA